MKTPNNAAGKLTEHIMSRMPRMEAPAYNRTYEAVYAGLQEAGKAGVAVVPDNDHAVMAIITSWPAPRKRRFYKAVQALFDADRCG